ncbi:MAG: BamA/TamA family outer membrane protein [Bacteroidales bacterium]
MRDRYIVFILASVLVGCIPTRNIPEDSHLLQRNKIVVEDAHLGSDDLRGLVRQKPNRKILGFYRFHLNVYQLADRGRENSIKRWMKNTIGRPPVLYDPVLAESTKEQFELFMQGKGYFNARVEKEVDFRGKRAYVTYRVQGNTPYRIRNISYAIPDSRLEGFVLDDRENALLETGMRYDTEILQEERERIARNLKDRGFHLFSREFIFFRLDSALSSKQLDMELAINDPAGVRLPDTDSLSTERHRRFRIDHVYLYPEYSPFRPVTVFSDTTVFRMDRNGDHTTYTFLHNEPLRIRPKVVANNILIEQGGYYSISDVEQTYSYLSRLRNFRFINIQFSENPRPDQGTPSDTLGFLDTRIQLTRSPSNAFTIEAEGLNTSGNLGVAGNLIFFNRNVFRGAEVFNLRLKGALEVSGETSEDEVIQRLPFNTLEMGAEASFDFPKLLFPIPMERLSKTSRPKSTILAGINYRQRPDYTRYILNTSYGFEWSASPTKRHHLFPLEISSIKIFNDSLLQAKIPDNNPLILSRFRDHLIAGTKYNFVYSNQQPGVDVDFIYFRGNLEAAGNLLYLAAKQFNLPADENQNHRLFNIPFAQYIKGEADLRYYRVFNQENTLAFRFLAGAGIPYGNIDVMPFIKSFYGGGANGVRAWRIYSLGPGSYRGTQDVRFDRYGDIKLEANAEYRFAIYKFWKGAFFVDAGNVWFLKENPQFPGGEFQIGRFYKDLAIGAGAGVRLDFDFFIIRVDAAFPVRDPSMKPGNKWRNSWPGFSQWNFNLGIGYPF